MGSRQNLLMTALLSLAAVGCGHQTEPSNNTANNTANETANEPANEPSQGAVVAATDTPPTTAKWSPRIGRGNEVISVLSSSEVCGLLTPREVEQAFAVKLDASKTTYERAIFSNGRFSGCTYFVDQKLSTFTSGRISWKVQSWPFDVERITDPSMKGNGQFPQAIAQTIGEKPAALQDFSTNVHDAEEGAFQGMLLTIDFDSFSVLFSTDQFEGHNNRVAITSLSELLVKRAAGLTPKPEPEATVAMSAYDRSDRQLCDLIRDESVFRWKPDSKVGKLGRLECDIDLRSGVDSSIRTTKNDAEFQIGRRVGYQDVEGEIVRVGDRRAHLVVAGNLASPELVAWVVLRDDFSVMFRVLGLTDTEANRQSVIDELAHIVDEIEPQ
jgi:hypothetical protein